MGEACSEARFSGRREGFSVQLTLDWLAPAFAHAAGTNTGNPRPRSAFFVLCPLLGRLLRLLLLCEQEGPGGEVGQVRFGRQRHALDGFFVVHAAVKTCSAASRSSFVRESSAAQAAGVGATAAGENAMYSITGAGAARVTSGAGDTSSILKVGAAYGALTHDDDDDDDDDGFDDGFVTVFEVSCRTASQHPRRTNIGWSCCCPNGCGKNMTVTWQTDFVPVAFAPLFGTQLTDHDPLLGTLSVGHIFDLSDVEAAHQDGRALKEVEISFRDLQTEHDLPSCLCRGLEVARQNAR